MSENNRAKAWSCALLLQALCEHRFCELLTAVGLDGVDRADANRVERVWPFEVRGVVGGGDRAGNRSLGERQRAGMVAALPLNVACTRPHSWCCPQGVDIATDLVDLRRSQSLHVAHAIERWAMGSGVSSGGGPWYSSSP